MRANYAGKHLRSLTAVLARGAGVCAVVLTLTLIAAYQSAAEPVSSVRGLDIGKLTSQAESSLDLSEMDAVILYDGREIEVHVDGSLRTTFHQIVWISTELGIEEYADLRVPYNTETTSLEVRVLRTWRDGRWWPHESVVSPTAVVETTPSALGRADDYLAIREMVLLHDGVEIPCIMETVYTTTESRPDGAGADGLWVFRRDDPAIVVRYSVSVPSGERLEHTTGNGAPEPVYSVESGRDTFTWEMSDVARLPRPHITDAAAVAPYVVWSTWKDWNELGDAVLGNFDAAAELTDVIRDTMSALVEHKPYLPEKAQAVVDYVDETTRAIRYDERFWKFTPRQASRTWETAYGHRLDRAVLALALFEEVGCDVNPVYRSRGFGEIAADVPSLSRFDGLALRVTGDGLNAYYDPVSGHLTNGGSSLAGRTVWVPGEWTVPALGIGDLGDGNRLELVISLESGDADEWVGEGFFRASGLLSPHDRIIGLSGEAADFFGGVVDGVLPGAEITEHNVAVLTKEEVVAGFALTMTSPEPDDEGRTWFEIGDPAGGVIDLLPGDVHTYSSRRESPVFLPSVISQRVTFRIKVGELESVRLPEPAAVSRPCGEFILNVEEDGEWITVTRELSLTQVTIPPDMWRELRGVLLANGSDRGRTLVFR
jgi:hypothetical protein